MRVYLDNCCYNRPYDDQDQMVIALETSAKLYVQELIKENQIELASSWFITFENSRNPHDIRRKAISEFLEENVSVFISSERLPEVEVLAEPIMKTGIKKMDACHVACAILSKCDCMLTTDKRLLKYRSDKILMLNPIDFITRLEDQNDERSNQHS